MSAVSLAGPSTGTYDVDDIAALLKSSSRHVRRLADAGRMPRPFNVGRLVRWRRSTGNPLTGIDDWLAAGCRVAAPLRKAVAMIASDGRERGERRAERGINRAAYFHEPQILRDMLRFLDALLSSPNGCATTDAAVGNLADKFDDGGKWRASIPKRLKAEGLIVAATVAKSCRLARHAGYLTEWRLVDRSAAEARRAALAAQLKKDAGESAATDSPAVDSLSHTPNGATNDGQAQ